MAMPGMYVSPEQLMQDRADYAAKESPEVGASLQLNTTAA